MLDAIPFDLLFDQFGVHALGWIIAVAEAGAIYLILRWIAKEHERRVKSEQERTDMVIGVVKENTETAAKHAVAFELITNELIARLRDLASERR